MDAEPSSATAHSPRLNQWIAGDDPSQSMIKIDRVAEGVYREDKELPHVVGIPAGALKHRLGYMAPSASPSLRSRDFLPEVAAI